MDGKLGDDDDDDDAGDDDKKAYHMNTIYNLIILLFKSKQTNIIRGCFPWLLTPMS